MGEVGYCHQESLCEGYILSPLPFLLLVPGLYKGSNFHTPCFPALVFWSYHNREALKRERTDISLFKLIFSCTLLWRRNRGKNVCPNPLSATLSIDLGKLHNIHKPKNPHIHNCMVLFAPQRCLYK